MKASLFVGSSTHRQRTRCGPGGTVSALLLALVGCSRSPEASAPEVPAPNQASTPDASALVPAPTTVPGVPPSQAQTTPAPGGYCVREVMPKTDRVRTIRNLTVDTKELYFTTEFPNQIIKVSKAGGTPAVVESYLGGPFVADDEAFHFVGVRDEDQCTYVVHVPKHGPAVRSSTKLCGKVQGLFLRPSIPVVQSPQVFVTGSRTKEGTGIIDATLDASLVAGSANAGDAIAANYNKVYWGVRHDGPTNDDVMVAVHRVPTAASGERPEPGFQPGIAKVLASKVGLVRGLAADEKSVYVAADYSLLSIPANGGTPKKLVVDPAAKRIWGVAVDAANIYWHSIGGERPEPNDSLLGVIPKASPDKAFVLAVGTGDVITPTAFAVDPNGDVYWASEGTIRVFTKTCAK